MRLPPSKILLVLVIVLFTAAASVAFAGALRIDFGEGLLQPGFDRFPVMPSVEVSHSFNSVIGASGSVVVATRSATGALLEWRYRTDDPCGNATEFDGLIRDFVLVWSDDVMEIGLAGLVPGEYRLKAYFHDPQFNNHGSVNVSVVDSIGARQVDSGVVQSTGFVPAEVAVSEFVVVVGATGTVSMSFSVTEGTGNAVIMNGFEIESLEPISTDGGGWGGFKSQYRSKE